MNLNEINNLIDEIFNKLKQRDEELKILKNDYEILLKENKKLKEEIEKKDKFIYATLKDIQKLEKKVDEALYRTSYSIKKSKDNLTFLEVKQKLMELKNKL